MSSAVLLLSAASAYVGPASRFAAPAPLAALATSGRPFAPRIINSRPLAARVVGSTIKMEEPFSFDPFDRDGARRLALLERANPPV